MGGDDMMSRLVCWKFCTLGIYAKWLIVASEDVIVSNLSRNNHDNDQNDADVCLPYLQVRINDNGHITFNEMIINQLEILHFIFTDFTKSAERWGSNSLLSCSMGIGEFNLFQ